jgi:hypothetical protein
MIGVCEGHDNCVECLQPGDCLPGEICLDGACVPPLESICAGLCAEIDLCLAYPNPDCPQGCAQDLADCSGPDLEQLLSCPLQECDLVTWSNCFLAVPCASG